MTRGPRFAEGVQVFPSLVLLDHGATSTNTAHVNLKAANWLSFLIYIGSVTSATSADLEVTAVASTANTSGSAVPSAVPFTYRLSGTAETNYTWGANTTGSSAGLVVVAATGTTDKAVWIDIDPADVAQLGEDYQWAHLLFTTSAATMTYGAVAFIEPKYPGNSIPSST
jgi:hypothetical protein